MTEPIQPARSNPITPDVKGASTAKASPAVGRVSPPDSVPEPQGAEPSALSSAGAGASTEKSAAAPPSDPAAVGAGAYGPSQLPAAPLPAAPLPAAQVPEALRGPAAVVEEKQRTFLGVSGPQVLAGALAASTSAIAASYLGVAGTVVGAGLGSVIASVSTAVYQKSIHRSNRVLQKVTTTVARKDSVGEAMAEGLSESRASVVAPDPRLPDVAEAGRGLPDPRLAEPTMPRVAPLLPGSTGHRGAAPVRPPNRPVGNVYGGGSWYAGLPWKGIAVASAAVFVLVMGVITTIEIVSNRTLAQAVHGERGDGRTTVGRSFGEDSDTSTSPGPSPSESSSEGGTPSDRPSEGTSPSDETSQSPAEQPSEEPSPSGNGEPSDQTTEAPPDSENEVGTGTPGTAGVPQPQVATATPAPLASPLG